MGSPGRPPRLSLTQRLSSDSSGVVVVVELMLNVLRCHLTY